jgi:hypothetical protein
MHLASLIAIAADAATATHSFRAWLTDVSVTPSTNGMPGAGLIQTLLGWLDQLAMWGALASILTGAAIYGIAQNSANYPAAFRGRQLAVAGVVGACLAGLAPTAVNLLFKAAGA